MNRFLPLAALALLSCKSRDFNPTSTTAESSASRGFKGVQLKSTDGTEITLVGDLTYEYNRYTVGKIAMGISNGNFNPSDVVKASLNEKCTKDGAPTSRDVRHVQLLPDAKRKAFGNAFLSYSASEGEANGWRCQLELTVSINGKKLIDPIGNKETFVPSFVNGISIPTPNKSNVGVYIYGSSHPDLGPMVHCYDGACSLEIIEIMKDEEVNQDKETYQTQLHNNSQYSHKSERTSGERSSLTSWEDGAFATLESGGGVGAVYGRLTLKKDVELLSGRKLKAGTVIKTQDYRAYDQTKW